MAQMIINIPDVQSNRVMNAIAIKYGWTSESGMTKPVFAKDQLIQFIKRTVKDVEGDSQAQSLRDSINSDVDSNLSLT